MKRRNVRVMLASEYPEVRSSLKGLIETEDGAVVVGEAATGTKALRLARNLKPDVAVIDSYLPYIVGLDNVPLSRVSGLDVAQSITQDIPNVRVVLLNSQTDKYLSDRTWRPAIDNFFCRQAGASCIPFTMSELGEDMTATENLVFANVELGPFTSIGQRTSSLSEKAIFFGALSFVAGWLCIITVFLAGPGAVMAIAGGVALLAGVAGKLAAKALRFKRT